jgi:hypothetical protein
MAGIFASLNHVIYQTALRDILTILSSFGKALSKRDLKDWIFEERMIEDSAVHHPVQKSPTTARLEVMLKSSTN